MKDNKFTNDELEEKSLKKQANIREWIATGLAAISFIFTIIMFIISKIAVEEIKAEYSVQVQNFEAIIANSQEQYQLVSSELTAVQEQYLSIQSIINQQQSVDVIEPRDNDVLIMTPDNKWIVVSMIEKIDFDFSGEIIEEQFNSNQSTLERVDLFNESNDDWTSKDSFTYTLPLLTINQNKMVNLYQFITFIDVEFKLYDENEIDYHVETINIFNQDTEYKYLNVFENIMPDKQFVTNDGFGFNGVEQIKITIIIQFNVGGNIFNIPYVFDEYITVNQDI